MESTIGFNFIFPVLAEDDCIGGTWVRSAIHSKGVKLVALFVFCSMPKGLGGKHLELVVSEVAKGKFFWCGSVQ